MASTLPLPTSYEGLPQITEYTRPQSRPGWEGTRVEALTESVKHLPLVQAAMEFMDGQSAPEASILDGYNPFQEGRIAGYEGYADEFIYVNSEAELAQTKAKIDEMERVRRLQEQYPGAAFVAEFVNPVNLIPIPMFQGAGILKGMAGASAAMGVVLAGEETARQFLDPTATGEEAFGNVLFGTMFGGILGGAAGAIPAGRMGRGYNTEQGLRSFAREFYRDQSGSVPRMMPDGVTPVTPSQALPEGIGEFSIRETVGEAGVAKAFGIEGQTRATLWGALKATKVQAVNDFADMMLGDYSTMNMGNAGGLATSRSVQLAVDTEWKARGIELSMLTHDAYARYLGEGGKEVLGMNTSTTKAQVKQAFGGKAPEGKMTLEQFKDKIFRSIAEGNVKIEGEPELTRAIAATNRFFEQSKKMLEESGALKTKANQARLIERKQKHLIDTRRRIAELEGKNKLTKRDKAVLQQLRRKQDNLEAFTPEPIPEKPVMSVADEGPDPKDRRARNKWISEQFDKLEDGEFKSIQAYPGSETEGDIWRFGYRKDGQLVSGKYTYEDTVIDNFDIGSEKGSNSLGAGDLRKMARELQKTHPEATRLKAYRLKTGARNQEQFLDIELRPSENVRTHTDGEFYQPRVWRSDLVLADEAGPKKLRRILSEWVRKENPDLSPQEIAASVDGSIATIIKDGDLGELQIFNPNATSPFTRHRNLTIPNRLVLDFIETDIDRIVRTYSERAGTVSEIYRAFGEGDAATAIDDVIIQAATEMPINDLNAFMKRMDNLRWDLERSRDKLTGKIYSMEPDMVNKRRIASNLRAYGILTYLGQAALGTVAEAFRPLMVHGPARVFDAAAKYAFGTPEFRKQWRNVSRGTARVTLQGLDSVNSSTMSRYAEMGGPTGTARSAVGRMGQKMTDFASGPYFIANLLGPATDIVKRMSQTFTHQFMLEDIHLLAAGKADGQKIAYLASYGIDADMAKRIVDQPIEMADGMYLPNMREWPDDQAALTYSGAVAGMTKVIVPTASMADVPEWAKGFIAGREFPLLTLPAQFLTYGFGAANRILLSSLQGRDRGGMMGIAAVLGGGYLAASLKADDDWWDSMSATERGFRAVDQSGITGIYSDMMTSIETATNGNISLRAMAGLQPYGGDPDAYDAFDTFGGPVGASVGKIAKVMAGELNERQEGEVIASVIPLNSLIGIKGMARDLGGDIGMMDVPEE